MSQDKIHVFQPGDDVNQIVTDFSNSATPDQMVVRVHAAPGVSRVILAERSSPDLTANEKAAIQKYSTNRDALDDGPTI